MRLFNRLLVLLFVRRKAQAHARAVLDEKLKARAPETAPQAAVAVPPATDAAAAPAPTETTGTTDSGGTATPGAPVVALAPPSPRDVLIREALAARKAREAEWDALTPEQKKRAIAGLGEGMAAIVKTFRAA